MTNIDKTLNDLEQVVNNMRLLVERNRVKLAQLEKDRLK